MHQKSGSIRIVSTKGNLAMKKILKNKYVLGVGAAAMGIAALGIGTSFAATHFGMWKNRPVAVGAVTAVNGNVITLTSKNGTIYTVDASNAAITKVTQTAAGAKPVITSIAANQVKVGDNLMVIGTASSANITATKIIDGAFIGQHKLNPQNDNRLGFKPSAIGTVSAINGNIITLTGRNFAAKSNTTYTVDASSATITKLTVPPTKGSKPASTAITISQIKVGDTLIVHGTVSGTNIQATTIRDRQIPANANGKNMMHRGFWQKMNLSQQPVQ